MTPVRALDPIAAIGTYWATEHEATDAEISLLQALANATSVALDKIEVRGQLESAVRMHEQALLASTTDELTGLLNRRGFDEQARAAWGAGQRGAVAFLDLDGLKTVDDYQGHDAGDRLLRSVALTLRSTIQQGDVVARIGGDEFAVFSPGSGAEGLHQRLTPLLAHASIGTAEVTDVDRLPDALLEADAAMYAEKRARLQHRSA